MVQATARTPVATSEITRAAEMPDAAATDGTVTAAAVTPSGWDI